MTSALGEFCFLFSVRSSTKMEMARQEGAAEEGVGIELEEYDAGVHRRSAASIQDEDEEPEATTPKPSLYSGGRHNLRRRHHRFALRV
jgi:hypothetical protein